MVNVVNGLVVVDASMVKQYCDLFVNVADSVVSFYIEMAEDMYISNVSNETECSDSLREKAIILCTCHLLWKMGYGDGNDSGDSGGGGGGGKVIRAKQGDTEVEYQIFVNQFQSNLNETKWGKELYMILDMIKFYGIGARSSQEWYNASKLLTGGEGNNEWRWNGNI